MTLGQEPVHGLGDALLLPVRCGARDLLVKIGLIVRVSPIVTDKAAAVALLLQQRIPEVLRRRAHRQVGLLVIPAGLQGGGGRVGSGDDHRTDHHRHQQQQQCHQQSGPAAAVKLSFHCAHRALSFPAGFLCFPFGSVRAVRFRRRFLLGFLPGLRGRFRGFRGQGLRGRGGRVFSPAGGQEDGGVLLELIGLLDLLPFRPNSYGAVVLRREVGGPGAPGWRTRLSLTRQPLKLKPSRVIPWGMT